VSATTARRARLGEAPAEWPRIGALEGDLIHAEGSMRLIRYRPAKPVSATPLLLVMPVINRAWIVDLTPETSFVGALVGAGIDTFVLDWGRPTLADREVGLDDLVARLLPRCELRALRASGSARLALAGYCLGGTIAVCRAALGAGEDRHAGLLTINAPVSFRDAGLLGLLCAKENFPVDALLAAFGNMPGGLLQQGFHALRPLLASAKLRRLVDKADDAQALEEIAAMELWNQDNAPVTGAFYRRLIEDLYRGDRLAKGSLDIAGRRVDLSEIACPVLVVAAKDDPICLFEQATALLDHAKGRVLEVRGGHVRSVVGSHARGKLAPEIASWLRGLSA
jgi:polyhydroxyalkanoate synthase